MRAHTVSKFSRQLTRFGLVNCYIVYERDGLTLIDTGLPGSADAILSTAEHVGHGPIRRILLTHAHGDHVGSLDALAQQIGGAVGSPVDVAIGEREAPLLLKKPRQNRSIEPSEPQCKVKGSLPGADTQPTHLVTDGELYGSLRCVATPGHTPGHFSFLDERDGTFYAGDALVTVGGQPHVAGFGPWYFPLPRWGTWHRPTAAASIRRLLTLPLATPIQRVAAGHGRVLSGGFNLLEEALARAS